jgi:hypothetical protein
MLEKTTKYRRHRKRSKNMFRGKLTNYQKQGGDPYRPAEVFIGRIW